MSCTAECTSPIDWDDKIVEFVKDNVVPGDTILDIGANVGNNTYRFSELTPVGKVYAIELDPETFTKLSQRTYPNNNVKSINVGISDENSEVTIYSGTGDSCTFNIVGKTETAHWMTQDHIPRGKIKCVTLDWLMQEKLCLQPQIIKIDVERAELKVLKGGKKTIQNSKLVIIENHEDGQFYELIKLLNEYDLNCYCLKNKHLLTEKSPSCYQFYATPL